MLIHGSDARTHTSVGQHPGSEGGVRIIQDGLGALVPLQEDEVRTVKKKAIRLEIECNAIERKVRIAAGLFLVPIPGAHSWCHLHRLCRLKVKGQLQTQ